MSLDNLTDAERIQWFRLGQAVRRSVAARGKATMYSYNGHKLPKLPEWDKEAYPYALIHGNALSAEKNLVFTKCQIHQGSSTILRPEPNSWEHYTTIEYANPPVPWEFKDSSDTAAYKAGIAGILWANYDVYNTADGTLHLVASEPIPVYE